MKSITKQIFESFSRDQKIVFIALATGGSFSPAGVPGFLFYDKAPEPFAVVFELNESNSFSRIDCLPFLQATEECKKLNENILSKIAGSAGVPTMSQFNSWNMMQRSAWIYNEWEAGDKPTGKRISGSPWFMVYESLGYGIIYHVNDNEDQILDAIAKPLTEIADDIEKYKLALQGAKGISTN